jgi:hypothetical protein
MYYIYGSVQAIPTYRVYRLYDSSKYLSRECLTCREGLNYTLHCVLCYIANNYYNIRGIKSSRLQQQRNWNLPKQSLLYNYIDYIIPN